jgi:hypothetical protein
MRVFRVRSRSGSRRVRGGRLARVTSNIPRPRHHREFASRGRGGFSVYTKNLFKCLTNSFNLLYYIYRSGNIDLLCLQLLLLRPRLQHARRREVDREGCAIYAPLERQKFISAGGFWWLRTLVLSGVK